MVQGCSLNMIKAYTEDFGIIVKEVSGTSDAFSEAKILDHFLQR